MLLGYKLEGEWRWWSRRTSCIR